MAMVLFGEIESEREEKGGGAQQADGKKQESSVFAFSGKWIAKTILPASSPPWGDSGTPGWLDHEVLINIHEPVSPFPSTTQRSLHFDC